MPKTKNSERLFFKANQLAHEGEYKKAIELFNTLLQSEPYNTECMIRLSLAYYHSGDYLNVIKISSDYVKLEPKALFVHQLRGRAFFKLEEMESSLDEFNLEIKKKSQLCRSAQ